jgi:hypothetical protein
MNAGLGKEYAVTDAAQRPMSRQPELPEHPIFGVTGLALS